MTFFFLLLQIYFLFNLVVVNERQWIDGYSISESVDEVAFNKQPLFIIEEKNSFSPAEPILRENTLKIFLSGKGRLVLVCPKVPSVNVNGDTQDVDSEAPNSPAEMNSRMIAVDQPEYYLNWSNIQCEEEVEAQFKRTEETCSETGVIYEIGFYVEIQKHTSMFSKFKSIIRRKKKKNGKNYDWYKLITICYDEEHRSPIYTSHTLFASSSEVKFRLAVRPNLVDYVRKFRSFSEESNFEIYYSKENQYENFVKIFGERIASIYYDGRLKYIKETQLTPSEDFLFPVLQSAAFLYLNIFPGWSALVDRSWKKVENMVREFSHKIPEDLVIRTGISGILQLKNEFGQLQNIYLDPENQRMKLPIMIWKTVFQPSTKRAIVFIMYHDPYRDNYCGFDMCDDVCLAYGWSAAKSNNLDRGCTFCCDFRQVKGELANLPIIEVDDILNFNLFYVY